MLKQRAEYELMMLKIEYNAVVRTQCYGQAIAFASFAVARLANATSDPWKWA